MLDELGLSYRDEHVPGEESADAEPYKDGVDHSAGILGPGPAFLSHFYFCYKKNKKILRDVGRGTSTLPYKFTNE